MRSRHPATRPTPPLNGAASGFFASSNGTPKRHTQLHRGPHPAELTGRIPDNGRRSKEVFLEEIVEQVLQAERNSMIVFAANDGECVDLAIELRQFLKRRRSGAIFLVHPVEQGEAIVG